ncbi:MAG: Asp-tRNA(Asn)/Glu-tRNA(Gln) amidotransferase subunit GatB [Thermovirgaceae bacterium]|nr:Asp-tRNA(Asn)/Glu-tRNA(Gln) amidotransferase subunit GatB [Thermovirgaceae bacterium]
MPLSFETVIGLEVHVQLATESKLFCSCPTAYIGSEPNTNVCPACLGLPGSLPSLNRRALELGVKAALALNCSINCMTKFHRKNYFYPDLPKAFQVSQYDVPLAVSGSMPIFLEGKVKNINITRLHLEEDAGKLIHETADGRLSGAAFSLVDYNRAGVPLAEIVSEPELSSPEEAREYVLMIRRLVRYLEVSDGDMESGSLRVDANISQKCSDGRWGSRVEIKNVNSLRAMERALEYETIRQRGLLLKGEEIVQETRHWDDNSGVTRSSRGKEEAHDYRYFPEPDLPQIAVERTLVENVRESLPEPPWKKREKFAREWRLSPADSASLSENLDVAVFLENVAASGADRQMAANWVKTDILRVLNETGLAVGDLQVGPEGLASLLAHVEKGSLSNTAAKDVLDIMLKKGIAVDDAMKEAGVKAGGVSRESLLGVVAKVLGENAAETALLFSGEDTSGKKRKFLQGLIMREIRGQAAPEDVSAMIDRVLDEMKG